MDNKMPKETYSIPAKEGILTIVSILITATLIELDAAVVFTSLSAIISSIMFILDMLYCYSKQIKFLTRKLRKKEKTLD